MQQCTPTIISVTDQVGNVIESKWLKDAEVVHRQLRPHFQQNYDTKMERVFADGGRMCVAVSQNLVVGVAVYRIYENTALGLHMYVDDLATDETCRSRGIGQELLSHMQLVARDSGCSHITLDSATHRNQAHRFYFREKMTISAFHFSKPLGKG